MLTSLPILSVIIFLPLVGALLILASGDRFAYASRWIAVICTTAALALCLALLTGFDSSASGPQFRESVTWIDSLHIRYGVAVDGISYPMLLLTALLTLLAIIGSWGQQTRPRLYFGLLLVLEWGVLGVFAATDFILFFLFWEVELIPMYFLIAIWGGPRRDYAAIKFVLYTIGGSALLLVGILALYVQTGARTFDMYELGAGNVVGVAGSVIFWLIFLAYAVKLPVVPLHTWLPDAHVEAPTAVSVLLAGVLLKMGGYGMIRLGLSVLPDVTRQWAGVLVALAVINVLYGAMVAMAQQDLKKLVAYSSVSHMGYVVLGLAAFTPLGVNGAVLQMFTHGTITGLLFFCVGVVYDKAHTRDIGSLGGLAARMPIGAACFSLGALASLGLPSMSGFVAEFLIFVGTFPVYRVATILAAFGIVLTAGYMLWMLERVFFGPLRVTGPLGDTTWQEAVPLVALLGLIFAIGIVPSLLTTMIGASVALSIK
jgi:NADH-quinone oxidoreductase subunit M